jgi:hypothetical protein
MSRPVFNWHCLLGHTTDQSVTSPQTHTVLSYPYCWLLEERHFPLLRTRVPVLILIIDPTKACHVGHFTNACNPGLDHVPLSADLEYPKQTQPDYTFLDFIHFVFTSTRLPIAKDSFHQRHTK